MPNIRINNLVKQYGDTKIIHDINLDIHDNEFTVFVGPSGCGKSTTLRMIAGLETVSSGEIYLGDKEVSKLEPRDRDLAMVFQDYALYPHMNVEKNLSFGLRLAGVDKTEIRSRIDRVAKMLGLDQLLDRKPSQLSGGQRQRVAMGRALVRDSSTLLMDEPLSNLDAKLRSQMRAELILMREQVQKTIIYVTHDQIEAMTLGDRIVILRGGYVQQHDTPETVFKRPANKFVAGFIGAPSMNFISAKVALEDDRIRLKGEGFDLAVNAALQQPLQHLMGSDIHVGIRPSAFSLEPIDSGNYIAMRLLVTEYIGAVTHATFQLGQATLTVELDSASAITRGDLVDFYVAIDDVYLFHPDTEEAIY